jgi:VanZ family protein
MPPMSRTKPAPPRTRPARPVQIALWCGAWGSVAAALVLSLAPRPSQDPAIAADKLLHVGGYGVMTLLFLLAAVWLPGRATGRLADRGTWVVASVVAFGLAIEALQPLVGRTAELLDGAANALGAALGWVLWAAARPRAAAP